MRKRLEPGDRIGQTVAIEKHGHIMRGTAKKAQWRWMCEACGSEFLATVYYNRKTCGCGRLESLVSRHSAESAKKCTEMVGRKFGRLTVIDIAESVKKTSQRLWLCSCDCGGIKKATRLNLMRGIVTSCGCAHTESRIKNAELARAAQQAMRDAIKSPILRGLFGLPAETIKKQRLGKISVRHVCRDES